MKQNKNWYFISLTEQWINLDHIRSIYFQGNPGDIIVPVVAIYSDGSKINLNICDDCEEAEIFLNDFAKENGWRK